MPLGEMKTYLTSRKRKPVMKPPAFIVCKYSVSELTVSGELCYVVEPRREKKGAVLFLHGGGLIMEAHIGHWLVVSKIVARTGKAVWFVHYPLLPECSVTDMNMVVLSAYRRMIERYPASAISIIGDSAGAAIAMGVLKFIRGYRPDIPVPARLVLVSPGELMIDEEKHPEIVREMREIDPRDVILNVGLIGTLNALRIETSVHDEEDTLSDQLFEGDFTGFPPTAVFVGTNEIFYPLAREILVPSMRAAGVDVDFIVGQDMCHEWPYIPFVPESARALNQVMEILRR
ncbi:MAG: alpha/beta hydrolase [Clostridiales Family XIII bacterium]|nr:alpha/beta hydrolase [Clostridiales Family XIII bacterium]